MGKPARRRPSGLSWQVLIKRLEPAERLPERVQTQRAEVQGLAVEGLEVEPAAEPELSLEEQVQQANEQLVRMYETTQMLEAQLARMGLAGASPSVGTDDDAADRRCALEHERSRHQQAHVCLVQVPVRLYRAA